MYVKKEHILAWLKDCADIFVEQRDFLTQLDTDIGDADHGLNMNRGFERVAEKIPSIEKQDISTIMKTTGMTLLSSVGGASGPLYGTFYIRAAGVVTGKEKLNLEELVNMLTAGVEGVVSRGRANIGDKTMCDVWWPVVDAGNAAIEQGLPLEKALELMVQAADEGVTATIEMQAKKGRASYLGKRSIGHQDPGATSSMMMVKSLQRIVSAG